MRRTIQEIADDLGTDKQTADHLVKFLEAFKLAKFKGERPSPRGKGPHVHEIESGAGQRVAEMIRGIEE